MTPPVEITAGKSLLVLATALILAVGLCACKRGTDKNGNSNGSATSASTSDPEQARRQAQSLVEQGKELYKNDEDEKATKVFKEALTHDPENAEAHLRLGMAHAALGNKADADDEYKKAVELYKKRVQADPKDADAFFYLGEAYFFRHQDDEAARAYRQATKLKPDDEAAFYQLGMAETRLAHYPEATAAFQKALELDPDDSRAVDALDNARQGTQRIQEGKKHAEDMLKKQQENANANSDNGAVSKPSPTRSPG
jgi:Flp pilus assembly protein TadD